MINTKKYENTFEKIRKEIINFAEEREKIYNNTRLNAEARLEDEAELKDKVEKKVDDLLQKVEENFQKDKEKLKENPDFSTADYQRKSYYVTVAGQLISGLDIDEMLKTYKTIAQNREWGLSEEFYNLAEMELMKDAKGSMLLDNLRRIRKENMPEEMLEKSNDRETLNNLESIIKTGKDLTKSLLGTASNTENIEGLKFRAESLKSLFDNVA